MSIHIYYLLSGIYAPGGGSLYFPGWVRGRDVHPARTRAYTSHQ
jgi:hypothetical protein